MNAETERDIAAIYEDLRLLKNSMANTGWQDRHVADASRLTAIMHFISDKYEHLLP
jgi:hypothetical protein